VSHRELYHGFGDADSAGILGLRRRRM